MKQAKTQKLQTSRPKKQPQKHHVRTAFASLLGVIALALILASILAGWLNRTLIDTNLYVKAVAPLAAEPEVQNFVAQKTSDSLLKKPGSAQGLAPLFLKPEEIKAKTPDQLAVSVEQSIKESVLQVAGSEQFATLWRETNRSAHTQLISQINSSSNELTLDLQPLVVGALDQLKNTKLKPIAASIPVQPATGKLNIKGTAFDKANKFYNTLQKGTVAVILIALAAAAASVWLSVHHLKTLRRIFLGTGILALLLALGLQSVSLFKYSKDDPVAQAAGVAMAKTLFHNLQLTALVIGLVCVGMAVASKFYSVRYTTRSN